MELSVIVIGWNSLFFLEQCLPSLKDSLTTIRHEVIYVDNGSEDGSLSYINENFPEIRCICNKENQGVSMARNQGIACSEGEYIWILDCDTVVNREAITEMLRYMNDYPGTGICACKLISEDGEVQDSCRMYPTISVKFKSALFSIFRKIGISISNRQKDYDTSGIKAMEVDYVIGACQLVRHEVFDRVGLLDEKIFYGPEDADFCLRTHLSGWNVVYLPYVSIIHRYRRITTRKIFSRLTYQHIKSLIYYFKKHNNHNNYGLS